MQRTSEGRERWWEKGRIEVAPFPSRFQKRNFTTLGRNCGCAFSTRSDAVHGCSLYRRYPSGTLFPSAFFLSSFAWKRKAGERDRNKNCRKYLETNERIKYTGGYKIHTLHTLLLLRYGRFIFFSFPNAYFLFHGDNNWPCDPSTDIVSITIQSRYQYEITANRSSLWMTYHKTPPFF